jgi:glutamate-1-semialdehyde aminotransferase
VGPAAALATIEKMERENVPDHLVRIGEQVTAGWERLADANDIALETTGLAPWTTFELEYENAQAVRTLFTQEMLQHGFLAYNSIYTSYAHTEDHVEAYLAAADDVFSTLSEHIDAGTVEAALESEVAQSKFERLN